MNSLLHKNNLASKPAMLQGRAKPLIQPKLTVNTPGDIYEQEADAMADRVMRMSSNEAAKPITGLIGASLQRKCAHCEEEDKRRKPVMRKTEAGNSGMNVSSSFAASLNASKGGGSPLPQATKNLMENAFSTDFSSVKIHTDSQASELSSGINAMAFTTGNDIYFNQGQYHPGSDEGKQLLAHELTHVIQQKGRTENEIQRYSKSGFTTVRNAEIDQAVPIAVRIVKACDFVNFIDTYFIVDKLEHAIYVFNPEQKECGWTYPTSPVIKIGESAFNQANCCDLASTLAHEAAHAGAFYTEGRCRDMECNCFSCGC